MSLRSDPAGDLPWDDARPKPARAEGGPHLYSVSELTREIKASLERLGRVSVEGEVTRITQAASGHVYFDLKDIDAKIACTIWKSQVASALRFELAEGMQVIAHGRLDVFGPRGTYSLNVQRLEQKGLGALLAELEELKRELRARGWFDRRRPLPKMPHMIGVVTSRDGAAFQDFLRTRSLRWPLYPVRLAHTSVQGAGAAREIAAAIARLDRSGVDVIVVCRGGGSLEDLWAFNERVVAEAVWNTSVPVVSGVGHETDVTLCDLVADHRAHTPTDAAQTVLPDRAALLSDLERTQNYMMQAIDAVMATREERLERAVRSRALRDAAWILDTRSEALERHRRALKISVASALKRAELRLAEASGRLQRESPALRLERSSSRLFALGPRLAAAVRAPLVAEEQRLDLAERSLTTTSPFQVLARGYSITRRAESPAPLTSAAGLKPGETIETRLSQGWILSRVEQSGEPPQ